MNKKELDTFIKGVAAQYKSQREFAKVIGLSPAYVGDVLLGRREPSERFLGAIGVEKVVRYELKQPQP